jgi:gamma-glutamyltranspeptidase/glutathione hydrolase
MTRQRLSPRLSLWALCAALFLLVAPAHAQTPRGQAMAVAANPHAVDAALDMLRDGGSAVDAAIAAELVLGLVEPQSSGIGGGGFLLYYDGSSERIRAYDGREWAPAGATPDMFLNASGQPLAFLEAQTSGRSIGTPLLVPMLKRAHEDYGRLPWARLFEPAIRLAEEGFAVSPRMAMFIAAYTTRGRLSQDANARAYFFDANGAPLPAGALLRNPAYAQTLRAIAAQGPRALTHGPIAEAIVTAANAEPLGGTLTLTDLRQARPRVLAPVCGSFRIYRVCTAPPPSSGNAVIAILGLYERARPASGGGNIDDWAGFLWASRLAYADRDHYMADDRFAPVPTRALFAPRYLNQRADLIDLMRAPPPRLRPGRPAGEALFNRWGRDDGDEAGTTHMSIVDGYGNAVALTATVESAFGSHRMVHGFLLNNQLTDFSFMPTLNGRPIANAAGPHKRPRSSMSPLIVTDASGELALLNGSAGGSSIIGYVARTTIAMLDWRQTPEQALSDANMVARFEPLNAESARMPSALAESLASRGWQMREFGALEVSGLHAIRVTPHGFEGGADPRREGVVGRLESPTAH